MPKRKPPTQTSLKKKADKVFSLLVREVGRCELCGMRGVPLQCAHIVSRNYKGIRWAFANAVAACAKCHVFYTHRPVEWDFRVTEMVGELGYLTLKWSAIPAYHPDYEAILLNLAEKRDMYGLCHKSAISDRVNRFLQENPRGISMEQAMFVLDGDSGQGSTSKPSSIES